MAKVKASCLEDAAKKDGSDFSFDIDDISNLECEAQSHEYVESILTDLSKVSSSSVSHESLCLQRHTSSSLLLEKGFYRPPEDAGIETFFQTEYQPTSLDKYYEECDKYLIAPVHAVRQCLEVEIAPDAENLLNLTCYGVGSLGLYLISQALLGPPIASVTHLDLSNSPFDDVACIVLSELLQQSSALTHLNLYGCSIGPKGAEVLSEGIETSQSLKELNMSKCHLRDVGGSVIVRAVALNENCKVLDLSHNELQGITATEIAALFKENRTLDKLNLKWNELYLEKECLLPMFKQLKVNENLKELNLAWNGISGKKFALFMLRAIKVHRFLRVLNLENNRISELELKRIIKMIKESTSLEELYLGGNIWSGSNVLDLIRVVGGDVTLKILDLGKFIWIPEDAYLLAQQIMHHKPDVQIIFKGKILPNPPEPVNFKQIIVDRAKYLAMAPKKKKMKRDMGHFMINVMDAERDHYRKESFENLLKKFKAKLDTNLIDHLGSEYTEKVKVGKRMVKRIALMDLARYYLERHPTERPPPVPPKKKRGRKAKNPLE